MCADPTTRPEILMRLVDKRPWGRGPYPGTQPELLASNPGVPIKSLVRLLHGYTPEVLSNPAFRMHLISNPSFLDELPVWSRAAIAGCPKTEERIIRYLAASRSQDVMVRVCAARNPETPQDMLLDYVRHDWRVREALTLNPRMPEDAQAKLARDKKRIVRCNLAERHDLLEETIEILVTECPETVDSELILNPTISDDVRWRVLDTLGFGDSRVNQRQRSQTLKRHRRRYRRYQTW